MTVGLGAVDDEDEPLGEDDEEDDDKDKVNKVCYYKGSLLHYIHAWRTKNF